MRSRSIVVAVAGAAILAIPSTAAAATKTVIAGPSGSGGGVFGTKTSTADVDAFSLKQVTIHVGDKVRWVFRGFHTVTFAKKGGGDIPFVIPDPAGTKVSGVNDAAGNPFWFNGQTRLVANPAGALPQGGKTEDGSALTGTGAAPGAANPKPYTLKFTKTGVFRYECVIHPGMEASVKVVAKGKKVPSAKADARTAARALRREAAAARKLSAYKPPANTIALGHDQGAVVQLRFFPSTLTVNAGTPVTFAINSKPEIHTASFGPPAYLQTVENGLITPQPSPSGPPTLVFSPQIAYPSDAPLPAYDGSQHGNGFLSTGVLDTDKATPQPSTTKITFSKPGTYHFVCMIHPFMHGTIVVK